MSTPDPYTDADKARMIKLWQQGLSLTEIAAKLSEESQGRLKLTKNSIRGKLRRMGVSGKNGTAGRPNPVNKQHAPELPAAAKSLTPSASREAARLPIPTQPLKPAVLRPNPHRQAPCSWPTSDGRPWTFCGAPSAAGKPYCEAHAKLAYAVLCSTRHHDNSGATSIQSQSKEEWVS